MAIENDWGAPRIHGELLKLGFEVDERTISRYMIIDNDSIFSEKVRGWLSDSSIQVKRTAIRSPWQKGYASHCTSSVRLGRIPQAGRLSRSLIPCCLSGAFAPGLR
ncbi:MAG TPA: hypothetical protein VM425_21990 [Myxococcota bacterium]|nr:hypothetical protein [Myxococcota bacterium]